MHTAVHTHAPSNAPTLAFHLLLQRALVATRTSGHVLLPSLLSSTAALFSATHHGGCCDVLGTTAEMFGEVKQPEIAALQASTLSGMIAASYNMLQVCGWGGGGWVRMSMLETGVCVWHCWQA
jgi:hypothetical protein